MIDIHSRLDSVKQRIGDACRRSGRSPEDVSVLLATKTVDPSVIRKAVQYGYRVLGENIVREALSKANALSDLPVEWHFIGHLQTNKVNQVLRFASVIESLDRLKLARRLQNRLETEDRRIDVFIQVNTSGEKSKYGIEPQKAAEFAKKLKSFDRIRIKGLMTIALFSAEEKKVRPCFQKLAAIRSELAQLDYPGSDTLHLSMGMSHDFEWAIEEGATIVRLGTAVFGERDRPDSYYWHSDNK